MLGARGGQPGTESEPGLPVHCWLQLGPKVAVNPFKWISGMVITWCCLADAAQNRRVNQFIK